MELEFNTYGNEKQKEVCRLWIDKVTSEITYGGSKNSGKSYLGCSLIFGDALLYADTKYFIARKDLNDIVRYTIPSIYEVFQHWGLTSDYYKFNGQYNFFQLYNGSTVCLLQAPFLPKDPLFERFGSMQMTRGWIEEAGQVCEAAKNNLNASIGRWKNEEYGLKPKLLMTCNPSKNFLYKTYKQNKEGKLDADKKFIQALPEDNKKSEPGYLERLYKTLSKNEIERLLKGNWEYDDDPSILMNYNKIIDLFTNDFVKAEGEKYITCDVARLGKDFTRIRVWHGFRSIYSCKLEKVRTTETATKIKELQLKFSVPNSNTVVDEDGVGGGVVDQLLCQGFKNGSSPFDENGITPNYLNLRSQCYFKLADKVNENSIFLHDTDTTDREMIIEELEIIKEKNIDKDTKKQVISREEIIQLIGRSPDYASELMMRMFFVVAPIKPKFILV